jgi:cellulose biosynthesis protein BcsQ
MDPSIVVWITLAINLGGVLMMLGGKNQVIKDLTEQVKRLEHSLEKYERKHDDLSSRKLDTNDYRRERDEFLDRYDGDRQAVNQEIRGVHGRLDFIERAGWKGGSR